MFDHFVGLALKGLISMILGFVLFFPAVLRLLFFIFSFFTFPLWFLFVLQNISIEIKISSLTAQMLLGNMWSTPPLLVVVVVVFFFHSQAFDMEVLRCLMPSLLLKKCV